jgi:putative endonuclease
MNVHNGMMRNWRVQHDEGEEQAVKKARKWPGKGVEIAAYYLDLHSCADRAWRVDVVAVQFSVLGKLEDIRVYQHAVTG